MADASRWEDRRSKKSHARKQGLLTGEGCQAAQGMASSQSHLNGFVMSFFNKEKEQAGMDLECRWPGTDGTLYLGTLERGR